MTNGGASVVAGFGFWGEDVVGVKNIFEVFDEFELGFVEAGVNNNGLEPPLGSATNERATMGF